MDALSGAARVRLVYCWRRRRYIYAIVIDLGRPDDTPASDPDALLAPEARAGKPIVVQHNRAGIAARERVADYFRAWGPSTIRQVCGGLGMSKYYAWYTMMSHPDTFVRLGVRTGPGGADVWGLVE